MSIWQREEPIAVSAFFVALTLSSLSSVFINIATSFWQEIVLVSRVKADNHTAGLDVEDGHAGTYLPLACLSSKGRVA